MPGSLGQRRTLFRALGHGHNLALCFSLTSLLPYLFCSLIQIMSDIFPCGFKKEKTTPPNKQKTLQKAKAAF